MAAPMGQAFRQLGNLGQTARSATERLSQLGASVGQVIQDKAMKPCVACGASMLKAGMLDCMECRQACCRNCFVTLSLRGPAAPKRSLTVCRGCEPLVKKRCLEDNVRLRMERVEAFLSNRLEPFKYDPESKLDQTLRLSGHVMHGLKQMTNFIPLGQAAQAVKAGYYVVRYGPMILAGNEIMEAFQLIASMARKIDSSASKVLSPDFFGGLYYTMAEHWGQRGRAPHLEKQEHASAQGEVPKPERNLLLRLRHVLRLVHVAKEPSSTDAQRLLRQAMPGAELLQAELSSTPSMPSYFLICAREARTAYLVMPGTRNPGDLATDFNAEEEEFESGHGHRGMVCSARWLMEEVSPLLIRLHTEGYRVTIVGHSLGAGVGAFLTLLLRPQIGSIVCYGFGTPACIDEQLQPALLGCMVSVINRDDIVPRLSIRSVQDLVQAVVCPGQVAKTQAWMKEDWLAVKDVERVVELRRRAGPSGVLPQDTTEIAAAGEAAPAAASAYGGSSSSNATSHVQEQTSEEEETKVQRLMEAGVDRGPALRALRMENGDLNRALLRATDEEVSSPSQAAGGTLDISSTVNASNGVASLLQGLFSSAPATGGMQLGPGPPPSPPVATAQHAHFIVPGEIVHLYRENGLSRAALAEASHDSLSRIACSQNLLSDHQLSAYTEALYQACIEEPQAPTWESFEQRNLCACCDADFTWAYILQSEPQKMLSRHNCFACGRVVCDGCSRKRLAHAKLGFPNPVRTCDTCAFLQYEGADDAMEAAASEEAAARQAACSGHSGC
eukprot:TRINITY_DN105652_c0_g1_i1.p1 TRINITY_DN105652_c0_g1~~TRINITY_DN105652_c0_g1_i1.p1  ORF type:complete len:809 (-),score=141.75 TRINITY_DN105652_c0_g1_i1:48-2399(-)